MSENKSVSLGEVVDILTGNPFKSAEYEDGEANPKLLRGDNIAQGSLRWENVKRWPKAKSEGLERYELKAGDVVLAMDRPWIEAGLKYACISEHDLPAYLVQRVARMRGTERLRTDFLRYLIGSRAFTAHVLGVQTGTAVPHISAGQIKSFEFDLPTLKEQESIAKYLGALDDKIELNRRMNETLEEMARALFRDWFVDFGPTRRQMVGATDPAAIMGHAFPPEKAATLAPLFPAKLGDNGLPEGWQTRSIYEVAKVVYGAPFKSKQFNTEGLGRPLARIRDLPKNAGGQFTEEVHKNEHLIQPGDIVVGMDGEFRSYLWFGVPTLMNQRICSFVPIEKSNRAFVWLAIKPLLKFFEDTAIATTVIHLGKGDIDTFSVIDAGQDVMTAFSTATEPMASKIVANGQENQTLAEMRDLLLPKLMSGEIRLKDAEAAL